MAMQRDAAACGASGVVVAYAEALAVVRLDPHREGAAEAAQA